VFQIHLAHHVASSEQLIRAIYVLLQEVLCGARYISSVNLCVYRYNQQTDNAGHLHRGMPDLDPPLILGPYLKSIRGVSADTGTSLPVAEIIRAMGGMASALLSGATKCTRRGTSISPALSMHHSSSSFANDKQQHVVPSGFDTLVELVQSG